MAQSGLEQSALAARQPEVRRSAWHIGARLIMTSHDFAPVSRIESPSASRTAPVTRRDFLYIATAAVAGVGAAASLIPLVAQMNPDAATLAAGAPVDFDAGKMEAGQQIVVLWQGHPIFVTRRSPSLLQSLQAPTLIARLADPDSEEAQQPPYARNWHRSIKPEFGVLVGICTHLGCIPAFYPDASQSVPTSNWPGGYLCPCHGSMYDLAGRVFSGVPAPYNLPIPPHRFTGDTIIRIGENPPDETFDFASIVQI
jgi:ubiquinol-cytochrome c reductase iron-sulfur subunit